MLGCGPPNCVVAGTYCVYRIATFVGKLPISLLPSFNCPRWYLRCWKQPGNDTKVMNLLESLYLLESTFLPPFGAIKHGYRCGSIQLTRSCRVFGATLYVEVFSSCSGIIDPADFPAMLMTEGPLGSKRVTPNNRLFNMDWTWSIRPVSDYPACSNYTVFTFYYLN